jgi:hypothetical protein
MSERIQIDDTPVTVGDASGFKFLEELALVGEIMEAVPLAEEQITDYTRHWFDRNGSENVLDRAAATYLFGKDRLAEISEEAWAASDQKLRLAKSPDGNAAFMRAFPSVYKHARRQMENLICLIATPNSKLAEADERGEADKIYDPGGPVHEMRRLILHRASVPEQIRLVLGSLRQLAEEMQAADLGAQMGEFRTAVKALAQALGVSDDTTEPESAEPNDENEPTERDEPVSEPSSSTLSSPATPASPAPTSSTASATAN